MPSGLKLRPDDLTIGQHVAVLGFKQRNIPLAIAGLALRITAIRLPFVVGQPVVKNFKPVTLDTRFLDLIEVPEEYITAQAAEAARIIW
ncbi:MAG TPA: hypothetical protein VJ739_06145 [Gemmataceae bacterium]|nr:hypothetical protein [Gemmataceae bacterium]